MILSVDWVAPEFLTLVNLLIFWLDILLKSLLVFGVPFILSLAPGYRGSCQLKHSVWLYAFGAMTLLPPACLLSSQIGGGSLLGPSMLSISVSPGDQDALSENGSSPLSLAPFLLLVYCLVAGAFLTRLFNAYRGALQIGASAEVVTEEKYLETLEKTKSRLGVTTPIQLRASSVAISPFAFGLGNTHIILPANFTAWSEETLSNVLLHEVMHVKRRDWLSLILVRFVTAIYWFNPLCWIAADRLAEEAEVCCDLAVIAHGKSATEYAKNLISIARQSRQTAPILAQMLVSKSMFRKRIKLILEGNMKEISHQHVRRILAFFTATLLVAGTAIPVMSADAVDEEYYPITTTTPYYPRVAADEGIEGYVLLEFTVLPSGYVDTSTVVIIDESPAGVFTDSALSAVETMQFSPRIVNGRAIEVPGVQFMYRYRLED